MSDADFVAQIDLHGERLEEGLERLEFFLDRAILSPENEVKVIHGHGTGRLKYAVRQYLKRSVYVASSHPGAPWEGGDGVTIVILKLDL